MSIDVMKLALDALEESHPEAYRHTITALRAAIEQAQRHNGWALREVLFDEGIPIGHREPQHKPLTDEEIDEIWRNHLHRYNRARAIEAKLKEKSA